MLLPVEEDRLTPLNVRAEPASANLGAEMAAEAAVTSLPRSPGARLASRRCLVLGLEEASCGDGAECETRNCSVPPRLAPGRQTADCLRSRSRRQQYERARRWRDRTSGSDGQAASHHVAPAISPFRSHSRKPEVRRSHQLAQRSRALLNRVAPASAHRSESRTMSAVTGS